MKKIKELKGITVTESDLEGTNRKLFLNDDMTTLKRQYM